MVDRPSFRQRYGPWALIAGASEGIGAGFARQVAQRGVNLALLSRRADPLHELAAEIRASHPVEVLAATIDLTSPTLMTDLDPLVDGIEIGLLVYNAGAVHGAAFLVDRPVDDALSLIDLNCRGPVLLAHRFGRAMAARGRGGIILMTSLSAASGSAYTAAYSATKAFDLVLAESLWIELGQRGVDVLAVPAGLTDTPAMRRSGIVHEGTLSQAMDAEDVAAEALGALGGPTAMHVVGEANRGVAEGLWPVPRTAIIEAMSAGAAALYGLPVPVMPSRPPD